MAIPEPSAATRRMTGSEVSRCTVPPAGRPWLARLLSCIRFDEILVLQGPPLFGALFAIGPLGNQVIAPLALLVAGNVLLIAHIFLFNDWAGIRHDLRDPSRVAGVFVNRGIRGSEIAGLSWLLLGLSLLPFGQLSSATLLLGLVISLASVLYSAPACHLKGLPIANSMLHLGGGLLHFLLGYAAFRSIDGRGIAIGCYFATIFTAGHLTQEVRDYSADLANGIRTNAVTYGQRRMLMVALALFACANLLLVTLAAAGIVPAMLALVALTFPLHAWWVLGVLRTALGHDPVRQLQRRYRLLYAGIGAMMAAVVLLS
jgi:4-hydroxybenzoate polyprenyltransferase